MRRPESVRAPATQRSHTQQCSRARWRRNAWQTGALTCALLWGVVGAPRPVGAAELTAAAIMDKNFVATKYLGATARVTFTLINRQGQERVRDTLSITNSRRMDAIPCAWCASVRPRILPERRPC